MYFVRVDTYLRKSTSDFQHNLHHIRDPTDLVEEDELRSECTRDVEAESLDSFVKL